MRDCDVVGVGIFEFKKIDLQYLFYVLLLTQRLN